MNTQLHKILDDLRKPFHPSQITWKPGAVKGERALAMPYADLRAYMNRLDDVCGEEWQVAYEPWGNDRIICKLTIAGVTRSSTGETTNESERSEIGGTVAEAQAFKRAAAMFGLGRYLYNLPNGWADYDPAKKTFTEKAKAKLTGILVQHYRRATEAKGEMPAIYETEPTTGEIIEVLTSGPLASPEQLRRLEKIGLEYYKSGWDTAAAKWIAWATDAKAEVVEQLKPEQADAIIEAIDKRIAKRIEQQAQQPVATAA